MAAISSNRPFAAGVAVLLAGLALGPTAQAQQMSTNSASYNAGYGRISGQENRGVEYGTRDSSNNRLIVDGLIQSGETQSNFSSVSGGVFASGKRKGSAGVIGHGL